MAKKKKSVKKGLIIGISSVVVLLAAAYAGVGYYFHDHFYPGTVINETNFSLGTVEAAEAKNIGRGRTGGCKKSRGLSAGCPRQRRPGLLYQWIGY